MVKIKCETVDEKRKVTVHDGASLEAPVPVKGSEPKLDVALLIHTRTELRKRQVDVDMAITAKIDELGGLRP